MADGLVARAVHKKYPSGVVALRNVDLKVPVGSSLVLIGESGCGKSTLLRLFNRLEEPTGGALFVRGKAVAASDPVELRRSLGFVPQSGGLMPHWTVARNVGTVPRLLQWTTERVQASSRAALELVGLEPESFADRWPRQLSGGQRQRVAFARALAADPEVVLLDEPFSALDALTRLKMIEEFRELKQRLVKTVLWVTHDLDEAFRLGDTIAVMRDGEILAHGTPEQLLNQPQPEYVERLLALRSTPRASAGAKP